MKINKKLLFKVIISLVLFLIVGLYLLFFINSLIANNNQAKGLYLLSEVSSIENKLSSYHLKYGVYPKSEKDVLVNNNTLCDYGFYDEKIKCDNKFFKFDNLKNNFTYSQTDGSSYNLKFETNYDVKELGCTHLSKEKKRGCSFYVNVNGLFLNK